MQEISSSKISEAELTHNLPKGLLKWLDLPKNANALFITSASDQEKALMECLQELSLRITILPFEDLSSQRDIAQYDYIFLGPALEYGKGGNSAAETMEACAKFLTPGGKMLLFLENRLGLRYFCGDADPCSGIIFDGLENYPFTPKSMSKKRRQLFDKAEIIDLLESAGFIYHKFYSVFPTLNEPQLLAAEAFQPNEELDIRLFPAYNRADSIFLREEALYSPLIKNRLFHSLANAFLVECALTETGKNTFEKADYVTISMNRGKKRAFATIVHAKDYVIKKPLFDEGGKTLQTLDCNTRKLKERGIPVAEGKMENDCYASQYLSGESLVSFLRGLLRKDTRAFLKEMDSLWLRILDSSEHLPYAQVDWDAFHALAGNQTKYGKIIEACGRQMMGGNNDGPFGPILKDGFIDLIALNAIMTANGPVFFDQEFTIPQLPARCVMLKNIDLIFREQSLQNIYPSKKLYERYGITTHEELYRAMENHFWKNLINYDSLAAHRAATERNAGAVAMNHFCMNQAARSRDALLTDIFADAHDKDFYVFGAGSWGEKFMAMYRHEFNIRGIVDNDPQKHGRQIYDLTVQSPDILDSLDRRRSKIIVCVKDCALIVRQLLAMRIRNMGVYNAWFAYPLHKNRMPNNACSPGKKYRLGYVAGVFDLFHVGHLNLLRRAKNECDYLIVGVVTDEGVRKNKHVEPVIPFEERLAVVQGCRYVDEAVEIPLVYCDTQDAWRKFQFDAQFSGSDYENDPIWLEKQRFLRANGSDLIFFPYTQRTSSSQIKKKMAELTMHVGREQ